MGDVYYDDEGKAYDENGNPVAAAGAAGSVADAAKADLAAHAVKGEDGRWTPSPKVSETDAAVARGQHNFAGVKYDYDTAAMDAEAKTPGNVGKAVAKTAAEMGIGVGKGAISTLYHIGRMTGAVPKNEDFEAALEGENTAQTVGKVAEGATEFAIGDAVATKGLEAAGAIGNAAKVGKVAQAAIKVAKGAAVGGAVTAAQGGSPGVGAALGAGGEVLAAGAEALAPVLKKSAQTGYLRFLNPTKNANKVSAQAIVDEALDRGIKGSLGKVAETATEGKQAANEALDGVYAEHGGTKVNTEDITNSLEEAKQAHVISPEGQGDKMIPMSQQDRKAVRMIDGLKQVVTDASTDGQIDIDRLRQLRKAWYGVANGAQANGYAGGVKTLEQTVHANAAESIKDVINSELPADAMVEKINHEYTFWKKFEKVANDTIIRKSGQGIPMGEQIIGGAVAGGKIAASGGIAPAVASGYMAKLLVRTIRSPQWTSASAVWKNQLANALAKGQGLRATSLLYNLVKAGAAENTGSNAEQQQP